MKPNVKHLFACVSVLSLLGLLSCSSGNDTYGNLTKNKENSQSKAITSVVEKVGSLMKSRDWKGIYELTSPELRKEIPVDRCIAQYEQLTDLYGNVDTVDIREIHLAGTSGDLNTPVKGESLVLPNPIEIFPPEEGTHSFVLCETKSNDTQFSCWLTLVLKKTGKQWFLSSFFMKPSQVSGHKGDWLIEKGDEFIEKKEMRNAYLYKLQGYQLLQTGPFISSPSVEQGYRDFLVNPAPAHMPFEGVRPAEVWKTGAGNLSVEYVGPAETSPFLNIEIRYKSILNDLNSPEGKAERKMLFDYVVETFPEYKDAFEGIYIGSLALAGPSVREYFTLTM